MSRMTTNGYAYIWIYVEDPALLTAGGSIEITSGGKTATAATSWNFDDTTVFVAGWNEFLLDVSKAAVNECDFSKINYIHVSLPTSGANTMMLDKMYLGVGEDFGIKPPETEPPATEPVTEAATTAAVTTAAANTAKTSNNTILYGIIAAAAVIVVIVVIAVIAKSKKKTK
jgi:hypothetical protein